VAEVRLAAGTFAMQRPATPELPYTAEIQIVLGALGEPDGVGFDPATPGRFGEAAPGNGVPFLGGANAKQVRFGRIVVDNAHGSERLPLNVPLRTEYWAGFTGGSGFVASTGDGCTAPAAASVILTPDPAGLATSVVPPVQGTSGTGIGRITLKAPDETGYAGVRLDLSSTNFPWLRGDWDNDGNWAEDGNDPSGRASFGLFKDDERRIFQREVVGN
jgi:MSHA biogenesis protein MshQ